MDDRGDRLAQQAHAQALPSTVSLDDVLRLFNDRSPRTLAIARRSISPQPTALRREPTRTLM
jgi:hypothetical protein